MLEYLTKIVCLISSVLRCFMFNKHGIGKDFQIIYWGRFVKDFVYKFPVLVQIMIKSHSDNTTVFRLTDWNLPI